MAHIEPMKAKAVKSVPADPDEKRVIEIKYDGWRCLAHVREDGVHLRTGSGKDIPGPYYIHKALEVLPVGTILDGEMVGKPGSEWNQAQSVCSRQRPQIVCPDSPALTFHVFDVLEYEGDNVKPLSYRERREQVERIVHRLGDPNIAVAEQFPCAEESCLAVLERGFEGVVVKPLDAPYIEDDRHLWLKVKPFMEIEAVCTGVFPGKGRLAGGAGGITFRVTHEDGTVYDGQCKGKVSETLLQEIWDDPKPYIGLVVEIIHWGINDGGALRHPNLRRFRHSSDKAAPAVQPVVETVTPEPPTDKPTRKGGRNYRRMGDEKLIMTAIMLEEGGDNEATRKGKVTDLPHVLELAKERGLL